MTSKRLKEGSGAVNSKVMILFFHFVLVLCSSQLFARKPASSRAVKLLPVSRTAQVHAKDLRLLTVFSWNMLNFGDKKSKKLEAFKNEKKIDVIERLGAVFKDADLVALQEVSTKNFRESLKYLRQSLQKLEGKGETLCLGFSDMSQNNKKEAERFAFVWRNSRVHYVTTQGKEMSCADNPEMDINFPLLTSVGEAMGRMPSYGTFLFLPLKKKFYYTNLHLRPTKKKPQEEILVLAQAFAPLNSQKPTNNDQAFLKSAKIPVFISGDFNLSNIHPAFQALRDVNFLASLENEKTSLHRIKRDLNQAYDNVWYRSGSESKIRKVDSYVHSLFDVFPDLEVKEIFSHISDHSPIEARFEFL